MSTSFINPRSEATITSKYYLISIVRQQRNQPCPQSWLLEIILWLKVKIDSLVIYKSTFEHDSKYKQLHAHLIVSMDKKARWRPYTKYKMDNKTTFRIHWNYFPPWNFTQVLQYITKECKHITEECTHIAEQAKFSELAQQKNLFEDSD